MASLAILVLISGLSSTFGYLIESDDPTESILWPSEYHFNAEKISLITGLKEPFEIWYSAEKNKSRIDYYGGMVKKYYYGETDESYGNLYMIHPETTEEETNKMVCYRMPRHSSQVDFLPSPDDFVYTGTEVVDGRDIQVWKENHEHAGVAKSEETLYVYRTEQGVDIPVQYINKVVDLWTSVVASHSITNYYNFKSKTSEKDLDAKEEEDCFEERLGENIHSDIKFLHPDIEIDVDTAFHSYKTYHNKRYRESEYELRKLLFHKTWRRVAEHNSKNLGYKMELNEFADRTHEELKYLTGTLPSDIKELGTESFPFTEEELQKLECELPKEYDLRLEGYITQIKNQASCGSCWAFSTTAAVEGAIARSNGGRDLDLSEQSLVDCAWGYDNNGCSGGLLDGALKYVLKHGIPTEREYGSYLQQDGYCHIENMTDVYTIKGFGRVTTGSVSGLKAALNKFGPVTVAIHVSENMKSYSSGVFYDISCEGESVNHGVTVVGYGESDGDTYWIVKNSWGENWGEDGYILMSARNNNCYLLDMPYYPIV